MDRGENLIRLSGPSSPPELLRRARHRRKERKGEDRDEEKEKGRWDNTAYVKHVEALI